MIRVCVVASLMVLAGSAPGVAQSQSDLTANAAMKYWQAFAQLPPRDEAMQLRLRDWATTPLDAASRKLVADGDASFRYLRRGAALPRCDWSLDYEDGIGLLLPHLDKARTLTLLTCLKARIALADGHPAAGLDDLLATLTLGRQIADPIMISLLVDYNVEANAGEAIGLLLPKLDADALKRLADRLNALPSAATVEQTLTTERTYFTGWAIRQLKEWERAGVKNFRSKLRVWFQGSSGDEAMLALVDDNSAGRLVKALEGLGPFFDEQKRLAGLPRSQFLTEWPALQKKQAADPVATVMLPAIVKVIDARDRSQARLQAAVDVARNGREALAKHRDSFGTGPFDYVARPQGFELRSALQIDGKPVTFIAGPPG